MVRYRPTPLGVSVCIGGTLRQTMVRRSTPLGVSVCVGGTLRQTMVRKVHTTGC